MSYRKRAFAYLRVSTQRQHERGIGLDAQYAKISAFAQSSNLRIVGKFEDCESATGDDHPERRNGFRAAMHQAREKGLPIIISDIDRVSRNKAVLEALFRDKTLTLISADDGRQFNDAILRSKAARAEFEGKEISRRTREALGAKKAAGMLLGNRTNLPEAQRRGADANRRKALIQAQDLLAILDEAKAAGAETKRDFADALNVRGICSAQGKAWTEAGVRRLLKRCEDLRRLRETHASDDESGEGFRIELATIYETTIAGWGSRPFI